MQNRIRQRYLHRQLAIALSNMKERNVKIQALFSKPDFEEPRCFTVSSAPSPQHSDTSYCVLYWELGDKKKCVPTGVHIIRNTGLKTIIEVVMGKLKIRL